MLVKVKLTHHVNQSSNLLLYSKLPINGRLVPFRQNYSLTRTSRAQVPISNPFNFPSFADLSYSRMEQICFTSSMDIKHGLNTSYAWNKMALGVIT